MTEMYQYPRIEIDKNFEALIADIIDASKLQSFTVADWIRDIPDELSQDSGWPAVVEEMVEQWQEVDSRLRDPYKLVERLASHIFPDSGYLTKVTRKIFAESVGESITMQPFLQISYNTLQQALYRFPSEKENLERARTFGIRAGIFLRDGAMTEHPYGAYAQTILVQAGMAGISTLSHRS